MTSRSQRVTVGVSATDVTPAVDGDGVSGSRAAIQNMSGVTVYVGGDDVDTDEGYPVAAGAEVYADLDPGEKVFAVVASGVAECAVFQTGV